MAEPPAKKRKAMADGETEPTSSTSSQAATPTSSPASSHTPPTSSSSQKYKADDLVTLLVGSEEQEKFVVHGYRLIESSEFFRAALQKEWKEGQTRIIELPEEDEENIASYLEFVFEGKLTSHSITSENELQDSDPELYTVLCFLYAVGERLLDTSLRNAIIKEYIRLSSLVNDKNEGWFPDWAVAEEAYKITKPGSPLRRLLVDMLVAYGLSEELGTSSTGLEDHLEPLIDVVKEFTRRAENKQNPGEFRCKDLSAEDYFV